MLIHEEYFLRNSIKYPPICNPGNGWFYYKNNSDEWNILNTRRIEEYGNAPLGIQLSVFSCVNGGLKENTSNQIDYHEFNDWIIRFCKKYSNKKECPKNNKEVYVVTWELFFISQEVWLVKNINMDMLFKTLNPEISIDDRMHTIKILLNEINSKSESVFMNWRKTFLNKIDGYLHWITKVMEFYEQQK